MKPSADKIAVARKLQASINAMQGIGKISYESAQADLTPFTTAFPGNVFPVGAIHECISYNPSNAAATTAFIAAVAGKLAKENGLWLWVAGGRKIFPAGLRHFGLEPDRIVFINTIRPKEALWVIEEALKCEALTAVIGEIRELSFSDSRRLQLAVENSGVTGFIHRYCPKTENAVACTTRWTIKALPSTITEGVPGVGHSTWGVHLLKMRNGKPQAWQVSWQGNRFAQHTGRYIASPVTNERQTG